ncbi:MAG: M14 family zinc carboxypeptidase [Lachnospiraceae bacterium]|nr:M14 family zinc carboxypeptidase [Lachnospiraceae bacterium]
MKYQEILSEIPDYKEFLTVDELDASSIGLASRYPDRVELTVIGHSRKGHPIRCLKIGKGTRRVLSFACPHPNEPIGAMTLEYLSGFLAENEEFLKKMDCTWYLIKCVDPDGTRLNEGWFKGPFTLRNYAEHYYRPAMKEQVEWTFPIDYKNLHFHDPIPETQALMKLIEEIRPDFLYSLHNAGFGGVFWYISRDHPSLYSRLTEIARRQEIPLSLGEPEMPCCVSLAPAVYKMLSVEDMYDFYEKYVCPDPSMLINSGASSDSYANRFGGTLTLVSELPYYYNAMVNDETPSDMSRRDAVLENCERARHCCQFLKGQMEKIGDLIEQDNPFRQMICDLLQTMGADSDGKIQMIQNDPQYDRRAKKCEVFDNLYGNTFKWMLFTGLLVHMIREKERELAEDKRNLENQNGCKNSDGRKTRENQDGCDNWEDRKQIFSEVYEAGQKELDQMEDYVTSHVDYEVIPIRKLVAVQLECALAALEYI